MVMVVVVILRGGVIVVMLRVVTLDVSVGEQQGGCRRWRLLGGPDACRQCSIALDGAIPTGRTQLGSIGEKAEEKC